jgi:hypothetical protein
MGSIKAVIKNPKDPSELLRHVIHNLNSLSEGSLHAQDLPASLIRERFRETGELAHKALAMAEKIPLRDARVGHRPVILHPPECISDSSFDVFP